MGEEGDYFDRDTQHAHFWGNPLFVFGSCFRTLAVILFQICIYPRTGCHHQNDSCIKTGSDESHFNVSTFEQRGERKRN